MHRMDWTLSSNLWELVKILILGKSLDHFTTLLPNVPVNLMSQTQIGCKPAISNIIISASSNHIWIPWFVILPLIGSAGAVFAGSTCALASIRDKDDYKNWAFGGAVAGSIFGIQG